MCICHQSALPSYPSSILEVMKSEFLQTKFWGCLVAVRQIQSSPARVWATHLKWGGGFQKGILQAVYWLLEGSCMPTPWAHSTNLASCPLSDSSCLMSSVELARHFESVNSWHSVNKLCASSSLAQSVFQLHKTPFCWFERGTEMEHILWLS